MGRTSAILRRLLIAFIAGVLVVALPTLAGCASDEPAGDEGTQQEQTDSEDVDEPAEESDGDSGTAEDVVVRLYFTSAGENALGIERTIPYTEAVATAAMEELLAGPSDAEMTTWPALSTQIPEGTELLGLTVEDGVAKVDLSQEFQSGGGTFSMTSRLAQVVYTLCDFETIDSVEFSLEGEVIDVFSGEGIMLDGPQTSEDYYDLLPIDA